MLFSPCPYVLRAATVAGTTNWSTQTKFWVLCMCYAGFWKAVAQLMVSQPFKIHITLWVYSWANMPSLKEDPMAWCHFFFSFLFLPRLHNCFSLFFLCLITVLLTKCYILPFTFGVSFWNSLEIERHCLDDLKKIPQSGSRDLIYACGGNLQPRRMYEVSHCSAFVAPIWRVCLFVF